MPALAVAPETPRRIMFDEFHKLATFWSEASKVPPPHARTFADQASTTRG
ncbi:MAG TPA: hypothetical protein VJL29_15080 [Thermoguttaceae bacterium]|nr:hypothetical protein [Thermoguttaceae bacterium]